MPLYDKNEVADSGKNQVQIYTNSWRSFVEAK